MEKPFDLYAGLFSVGELAELSGINRPIVDVWISRGIIESTRREKPMGRKPRKGIKSKAPSRGRPLFSCRDVFKAFTIRTLSENLALSSTDSSGVASGVAKNSPLAMPTQKNAADIANALAGGEWMFAVARRIESGKPLYIGVYASRIKGHWQFDMQVGSSSPPCFGLAVPHIFIPVSLLFADVYAACKTLLENGSSDEH